MKLKEHLKAGNKQVLYFLYYLDTDGSYKNVFEDEQNYVKALTRADADVMFQKRLELIGLLNNFSHVENGKFVIRPFYTLKVEITTEHRISDRKFKAIVKSVIADDKEPSGYKTAFTDYGCQYEMHYILRKSDIKLV